MRELARDILAGTSNAGFITVTAKDIAPTGGGAGGSVLPTPGRTGDNCLGEYERSSLNADAPVVTIRPRDIPPLLADERPTVLINGQLWAYDTQKHVHPDPDGWFYFDVPKPPSPNVKEPLAALQKQFPLPGEPDSALAAVRIPDHWSK